MSETKTQQPTIEYKEVKTESLKDGNLYSVYLSDGDVYNGKYNEKMSIPNMVIFLDDITTKNGKHIKGEGITKYYIEKIESFEDIPNLPDDVVNKIKSFLNKKTPMSETKPTIPIRNGGKPKSRRQRRRKTKKSRKSRKKATR